MVTESLASILSNEEVPEEVLKDEAPAPKDDYVEVTGEEESPAKVEPKVEPKLEPKQEEPKDEKPKVPRDIAGIIDERRKRQDAERRLAEYQAKSPKPKVDFFDNPEEAINSRLSESLTPLQQEIFTLKLELAKTKNADFDDCALAYLEAAENDPVLKYQGDNAPDPLAFIYREGKRIKELAPFGGDIERLVESRLGSTKSENLELKKQLAALKTEVDSIKKAKQELDAVPRSLNSTAPSASAPKSDDEDEPELKSIFRNKF